jgi:hypothetical protein
MRGLVLDPAVSSAGLRLRTPWGLEYGPQCHCRRFHPNRSQDCSLNAGHKRRRSAHPRGDGLPRLRRGSTLGAALPRHPSTSRAAFRRNPDDQRLHPPTVRHRAGQGLGSGRQGAVGRGSISMPSPIGDRSGDLRPALNARARTVFRSRLSCDRNLIGS